MFPDGLNTITMPWNGGLEGGRKSSLHPASFLSFIKVLQQGVNYPCSYTATPTLLGSPWRSWIASVPCFGASFELWSGRRKKNQHGSGQVKPGFQIYVASITNGITGVVPELGTTEGAWESACLPEKSNCICCHGNTTGSKSSPRPSGQGPRRRVKPRRSEEMNKLKLIWCTICVCSMNNEGMDKFNAGRRPS